ncbi:hypothetical protein ACIPRI_21915 [Variovorax sp. LARHSF232]
MLLSGAAAGAGLSSTSLSWPGASGRCGASRTGAVFVASLGAGSGGITSAGGRDDTWTALLSGAAGAGGAASCSSNTGGDAKAGGAACTDKLACSAGTGVDCRAGSMPTAGRPQYQSREAPTSITSTMPTRIVAESRLPSASELNTESRSRSVLDSGSGSTAALLRQAGLTTRSSRGCRHGWSRVPDSSATTDAMRVAFAASGPRKMSKMVVPDTTPENLPAQPRQ